MIPSDRPVGDAGARQRDGGPTTVFFLVLPDYTCHAVASAIDVLHRANQVMEREAYAWRLVTEFDETVLASNGLSLMPCAPIAGAGRPELLFVCGGANVRRHVTRSIVGILRTFAADGVALGGLSSGGYALAQAGLLDGHTAVVQRGEEAAPTDDFPSVIASPAAFAIDRDRFTASASAVPLMLLQMVAQKHGQGVAMAMAQGWGDPAAAGQGSDVDAEGQGDDREMGGREHLVRAAELMEAHIRDPLSMDALAQLVGVSRRQLERLFKRHLGTVPSRYYMGVRLRHAQSMVIGTTTPMGQIGASCGFESAAHFTRCYRAYFGHTPSSDRA